MRKLRIVLKENKNSLLNEVSYFRGQSFRIHQQLLDTLRTKDAEKLSSIEEDTDFRNGFPQGSSLANYTALQEVINRLDGNLSKLDPENVLGESDTPFIALLRQHTNTNLFFKTVDENGDSIPEALKLFYRATVTPLLLDETKNANMIAGTNILYNRSLVNTLQAIQNYEKKLMAGQGANKFVKFFVGPGAEQKKELIGIISNLIKTFINNVVQYKISSDSYAQKAIQSLGAAPAAGGGGTTAPPEGGSGTATPPEGGGGAAGGGEAPPTTAPEGGGGAGGSARPPAGTPIPVSTDLFRALSRSVPRWATAEIIRTLRSELGAAGYPLRESIKSSDSTLDILLKEEMSLLLEATRRDYMRELERAKTSAELDDIVARVNKEDKSIRNNMAIQDRIKLRRQELEKTTSASAPSAEPESSASPTDSKPDTESTSEAKDYFKELVVDKAPEKEAELDKMITQQKGMKEILRDYTLWLLKRKREAEDATKQKVGTPEFEKEAPKFFEKYSRMVTATRKLVQLFEDAESDREITDKRAVKMHVEAAFPKSAGFSNNIRELIETMLGERAGSAKDTRRDFQKAPSKGLVKDAGKAGKQVDLKKFQGFISSLRPPEGQKPLANKDAAVNIVRKFLSNYGIKLTESQTIRMINNLISESRYQTKVIKEYREHIQSQLIPYMQKQIGFNKPPVINFLDDTQNASDPFGKTAFYDPQSMEISVYTTGRHPKDIMRSVAHEVIHHAQNCRGQLDPQRMGEASEGYAQRNPYLRKLEEEAYLLGNMTFRDWEDGMKKNQLNEMHDCNKVHPNKSHAAYKRDDEAKEEKSLDEWKNEERWDLLMKRFKIVSEKRFANDPKLDKDGDGKPKWADEDDDNPEDSKKQVKGKK